MVGPEGTNIQAEAFVKKLTSKILLLNDGYVLYPIVYISLTVYITASNVTMRYFLKMLHILIT